MVRKESYLVHEAWGDHQLKKDEARGLGMKTVTGRERSVCFAQVVPAMHAAELLEVCTTWKGNKDTHTAKNGYDGHTGDLEAFRDGQGRSWSGSGFRNNCDFCGSSIITRGSCPPVWDCHPGKKHRRETAPGLSNPGKRQESSDRQWPQQPRVEDMGWAGLAELIPQGRPPTLHTANCSSANHILHGATAISELFFCFSVGFAGEGERGEVVGQSQTRC